jgi:hypothetical protein
MAVQVIRGANLPQTGRAKRIPRKTMQERLARQAVIERALSKYLPLVCGHFSTLDTDLSYSCYRPKRGVTFCESCNDWVEVQKPPAPPEYPDNPAELF